jgi:molybdopterin/thiamine biosynthesis adenylyltransferase
LNITTFGTIFENCLLTLKNKKSMKSVKQIAFAALLTIGAFGAVTLVSCNKDDDESCPAGYEGTDCKTLMSTKFVGTYSVTENCTVSGTVGPYTATITAAQTNNVTILLQNFGDFNATITVTGTINGNTLSIAQQTVSGYSVSGNGTYVAGTGNAGVLTVNYTIGGTVDTESCTATWTKQ